MNNEPTNEDRAERVARMLEHYVSTVLGEVADEEPDSKCELASLLADVMHFCKQHDIDYNGVLALAEIHYQAELDEVSQ